MKFLFFLIGLLFLYTATNAQADTDQVFVSDGHMAAITNAAISQDDKYLLTGSQDNYAILWDIISGRALRKFKHDDAIVTNVNFFHDGRKILTRSYNRNGDYGYNTATIWDMVTGKKESEFTIAEGTRLTLDPSDEKIMFFSSSPDSSFGFVDLYGHSINKYNSKFAGIVVESKDGKTIYSCERPSYESDDYRIIKWLTGKTAGTPEKVLDLGSDYIEAMSISADNSYLAVVNLQYAVTVWNTHNWTKIVSFDTHFRDVKSFQFSPDGNKILTTSKYGDFKIWDAKTGKMISDLQNEKENEKHYSVSAFFSPDGQLLGSFLEHSFLVSIHDASSNELIKDIAGQTRPIIEAAFSNDGRFLVTNPYSITDRRAWDLTTGMFLSKVPSYISVEDKTITDDKTYSVSTIKRSTAYVIERDNQTIYDDFVVLRNLKSKKVIGLLPIGDSDWLALDAERHFDCSTNALTKLYMVNGLKTVDYIKTTAYKRKISGLVTLLTNRTGKQDHMETKNHKYEIVIDSISTDNPEITITAKIIKHVEVEPKVEVYINSYELYTDAWSQNKTTHNRNSDTLYLQIPVNLYKKVVAYGKPNSFQIRLSDPETKASLTHQETVFTPPVLPDLEMVVPLGHTAYVSAIELSPDNNYVFTASGDNNAKMWDIKTGRELKTYHVPDGGGINAMAVSSNGKYLMLRYGSFVNDVMPGVAALEHFYTSLWRTDLATRISYKNFPFDPDMFFSSNRKFLLNLPAHKMLDMENDYIYSLPDSIPAIWRAGDVTADGTIVVLSAFDRYDYPSRNYLLLYNTETKKIAQNFKVERVINQIIFSKNAKQVAALTNTYANDAVQNYAFTFWDVNKANPVKEIALPNDLKVQSFQYSQDDQSIMVSFDNGEAGTYNVASGIYTKLISIPSKSVSSTFISKDGNLFLAGKADGSASLYNAKEVKLIQVFKRHVYTPTYQIVSPSYNSFLFWTRESSTLRLCNLIPGDNIKLLRHQKTVQLYDYTPDGKYIISIEKKGNAYLWNALSGQLIKTFSITNGYIRSKFFTEDLTRIVFVTSKEKEDFDYELVYNIETGEMEETADDKSLPVYYPSLAPGDITLNSNEIGPGNRWDGLYTVAKHNETIARFALLDSTDWVLYTRDGFYMSSRDGAKKVYFIKNNKQYLFDQFDLQYNRPDQIFERLGIYSESIMNLYKQAYLKRLSLMHFSITDFAINRTFNAPIVTTASHSDYTQTTKQDFGMEVTATDEQATIDRFEIRINGIPLNGLNGLDVKAQNNAVITKYIHFFLSEGDNFIQVSAFNSKGVESIAEEFTITYSTTYSKHDLYAITIGAGSYKNKAANLAYADKDAKDIGKLFTNDSSQYDAVRSYQILNEQVTKENILALKKILQQANINDKVILYYAGHGTRDKSKQYYLGTYDIDFSEPSKRGILYEDLLSLLTDIPIRNRLMVIDACYSGESDKDDIELSVANKTTYGKKEMTRSSGRITSMSKPAADVSTFDLMKSMYVDLRQNYGVNVISSSSGVQVASEDNEWKNGIFTHCLLEGIQFYKADLNQDKTIMLSELEQYLQTEVGNVTNGKQTPSVRSENLYKDISIY